MSWDALTSPQGRLVGVTTKPWLTLKAGAYGTSSVTEVLDSRSRGRRNDH